MNFVQINDYCFDRIHVWLQYAYGKQNYTELVLEVFYPKDQKANGLVMFNHGFLIGVDLLYYPKKLIDTFFGNDSPLFQVNPSSYYNYTTAIVEKHWAMAFVTSCHFENQTIPWTDFGGNPRVGQEAYAAASYLIRYGVTNSLHNANAVAAAKFMNSNNVIFAGHSVGGAHAQAAAVGFDNLQRIGSETGFAYDPVMFDREILPFHTEPFSEWTPQQRANPVGLFQLSPVDAKIPLVFAGMEPYRTALSTIPMPILMTIGQCDCACTENSTPPAWSDDPSTVTEFTQMAPPGSASWAVVAKVEKGSHCGYLTEPNSLCSIADSKNQCSLCPDSEVYKPAGPEATFTAEMLKRFIAMFPANESFQANSSGWIQSDFIKWLNTSSPDGVISLVPFKDGKYVHYVCSDNPA